MTIRDWNNLPYTEKDRDTLIKQSITLLQQSQYSVINYCYYVVTSKILITTQALLAARDLFCIQLYHWAPISLRHC